ncbi:FAD-dependent oxidoreductase [Microbacterium kribbense]|uniref:FAD-dependent oxidoreductase n=1 Tax=Microbacterium kribbense TaxID=433645 RepID=A0ABP7G4P3_9MICO
MKENYDVPVLIAGGSLVGLTTSALLGDQGVTSLVVERHPGEAIHPRAALMLQRSMEIYRGMGVEDTMRERSFQQFDPDGAIMAVETVAGKDLAWYMTRVNDGVRDLSPSERIFVTQIAVEPVLRARAEELGSEVLYGTEMVDFEQDADGVTATIRNRASGDEATVRAKYLIAAEGPHSMTREKLGITRSGHGSLSKSITIYFRADVGNLMRGRNLSVIMVVNPEVQGFFRIEKPYESGFLVVHGVGDPQNPRTDLWDGLTDEKCVEWVRAALGVPDIPVEIYNVMKWEATAITADEYRNGRIFLAGDAAHEMPPYGGYGGNTGIHDAHNLAWKIAAVLSGAAGDDLLSSYETERRPVGAFTVEQGYSRFVVRAVTSRLKDGIEPVVPDDNIDLGYRYHSSAIASTGEDDAVQGSPRSWRAEPGTRAPSYDLVIDGEKKSTIDLFGHGFVLLTGSDAAAWRESGARAAEQVAMGLTTYTIDESTDPTHTFCNEYGITSTGAVLVRPDGFVVWRAVTDVDAHPDTVAQTMRAVLGLPVSDAVAA